MFFLLYRRTDGGVLTILRRFPTTLQIFFRRPEKRSRTFCEERKSDCLLYFRYSLSLSKKIQKSNVQIFVLVRFAFLSYGLLFQFINRNKHLLFCYKIITVISVEL